MSHYGHETAVELTGLVVSTLPALREWLTLRSKHVQEPAAVRLESSPN